MNTKYDITGIHDIKLLVDDFYRKVGQDELLAPIFNFRLSTNWEPHLEKMYTFWNAALFGIKGYHGNPFSKHATMKIEETHFQRWLNMFNETVNMHFEGPCAEDAKKKALAMADMFRHKLRTNKNSNIKSIF
jgi:hemoglobin